MKKLQFLLIFILFSFFISCEGKIVDSCDDQIIVDINPTFSDINSKILQPKCAISGCHSNAVFSGLSLANDEVYNNLLNSNRDYVLPSDADNSLLYLRVSGSTVGRIMPPPPRSPLSNDEVEAIQNWINLGAEEN